MNKQFLACFFALALMIAPRALFAHAVPIELSPGQNKVLTERPAVIRMVFSERIEPSASGIKVYSPKGVAVETGPIVVDAEDPHRASVAFTADESGTYAVSWQAVSADDGHFSKGAYVFSYGAVSIASGAAHEGTSVDYSTSIPESVTVFVELLAQALLLAILILYPRFRKIFEAGGEDIRRWDTFAVFNIFVASILGVCAGVGYLVIRASDLSLLQSVPFMQGMASFLATVAGSFSLYRVLGIVLILGAVIVSKGKLFTAPSRFYRTFILIVLLCMMAMRARVSHAAASDFAPVLSVLINFLHLVFKDIWIGGIIFTTSLLARARSSVKFFMALANAFSALSVFSLSVGGATGAYIVWLHLKGFGNISGTTWGYVFLYLSLATVPLLVFRMFHVFFFEPSLARTPDVARKRGVPYATYAAESFFGLAVLYLSAVLIITTPPLMTKPPYAGVVENQDSLVRLYEREHDHERLYLTVRTKQGVYETLKKLTIVAMNEEKNIGPIEIQTAKEGVEYVFPGSELSPPGSWDLSVTAEREGAYDVVASFAIAYPFMDHTGHSMARTFDDFAAKLAFAGVLPIVLAFIVWRRVSATGARSTGQKKTA